MRRFCDCGCKPASVENPPIEGKDDMSSIELKTLSEKIRGLACVAAVLLGAGAAAPLSTAAPTEDPWADMRAGYASLGTEPATVEALVSKLESGQPVDAFLGAEPVSSHSYVQIGDGPLADDGDLVTVSIFPDGSANTVAVESPSGTPGGVATMAQIGGCSVQTGSGYQNSNGCSVTATWSAGAIQAGFVASYSLIQGGYDQIIGTGMTWQRCSPMTCSSPTFTVKKMSEGFSGPAVLRGQSDVTAPWGSWNVWVALNVGGDRAWATQS